MVFVYKYVFLPLVKVHALFSHTCIKDRKDLCRNKEECAFFGASTLLVHFFNCTSCGQTESYYKQEQNLSFEILFLFVYAILLFIKIIGKNRSAIRNLAYIFRQAVQIHCYIKRIINNGCNHTSRRRCSQWCRYSF